MEQNLHVVEQAIVGCLLKHPQLFREYTSARHKGIVFHEDLFPDGLSKGIIREYLCLLQNGVELDHIILRDALISNKRIEPPSMLVPTQEFSNSEKLDDLIGKAVDPSKVSQYLKILSKDYVKRRMQGLCRINLLKLNTQEGDALPVLKEMEWDLMQLRKIMEYSNLEPILAPINRFLAVFDERIKNGARGLMSGFSELDRITNGFKSGELIVLGGRPAMGKSSFLLSLASNMTGLFKSKVALLSLEQSGDFVTERFISISSGISYWKIVKGMLKEEEEKKLRSCLSNLKETPLFIGDIFSCELKSVVEEARKAVKDEGVSILLIDYLQMIRINNWKGNRESEMSKIMGMLKELARDLNVPVIVSSQLSRAVETRGGDKKPQLSDLRESGSIEQDADKVFFLHRPEYYGLEADEAGNSTEGVAELIIAKNRSGKLGSARLKFDNKLARFDDWEKGDDGLFGSIRSNEFIN